MELFENLELTICAPRPLNIVTPLGAINSNILINSQLLSAANSSHFYSLQTGGFAARWDLSLGIAEVIVARPALIAEYRAEITDCWAFL